MGKVYLIANEEWTQFKIGISTRELDKRINTLKTGNGSEISLVKSFDTIHHRKVEKWMHNKYNSKRLVGEWFALGDDDIINLFNLGDGYFESAIILCEKCSTGNEEKVADVIIFPIFIFPKTFSIAE